jgi:hypothetical protein
MPFPSIPFPWATASPIPGEDAVPLDPLPATPRSSRGSMKGKPLSTPRHADELRSGGGVAARHTPPPLHIAEYARLPPKSPPLRRQRPAGPPSSHPRGRGTSHNGRALCAAPSAASGRSPRCRPSWLTYPVRRSSGGVEARPDRSRRGSRRPASQNAASRLAACPFASAVRRAPAARRGACHRPPLPGRTPAPGPARAGRPRTPPLAAAPRRGAGAGIPHLTGVAGGGRRRCPAGNARPAGFRTRGFFGVPIMPLVNVAASWSAGRALRADANGGGVFLARAWRAPFVDTVADRSSRRLPPETRSGLARRTSSPARTPPCGGPWPGRPAVRARDTGPASASRFPVSLASSAGSRGAVAHSKKPRPCFGLTRSQASATPSPGPASSRRRHRGATPTRAA